jgi:LysW-gamma-L-lysine carboxypeptidase
MAARKKKVIIVGAVDEEGLSRGARNIFQKFSPEMVIIGEPSGWSNVTLGYKGCLNLFYENRKRKEHCSSPGMNCNEEAVLFFNRLTKFSSDFNLGKSLFEQLGMKLVAISSDDDGFFETVKMSINFRIPAGFVLESLKEFAERSRAGANINYSGFERPVRSEKNNRLVSAFVRSIREQGGVIKFKLKSGTSDMNILQDFKCPIVAYGPGDSNLDHTPNENLDLEEYAKSIEVLSNVLKSL